MLNSYKKLLLLLLCLILIVIGTFIIKFYFKPFIIIVIMSIVCNPLYKIMIRLNISHKIAGVMSIFIVNILIILIILYLGNQIFDMIRNIYISNLKWINNFIEQAGNALNLNIKNFKIGKSVFSIINDENVRRGAISTGESILAYFIANICTFFVLIDKKQIIEFCELLVPQNITGKIKKQKENFTEMISIQGILVLVSTLEIIVGFMILRIPRCFMLGIICGILDLLPYVGTIIVFIPIIIYNIIMKNYVTSIGLIALYILVQIIRELLEAKFLGSKLDIHPIIIFISIYIGVNIFGVLGILIGPMYSILAKEIIYSND